MPVDTVPPAIVATCNQMPVVTVGTVTYKVRGQDPPPPASPDTAKMPALYVFTGTATDDDETGGDDLEREARIYRVQVAVLPTGQGTPAEREIRCRPILKAVKAWLKKYPHLGTQYVEHARVLGDSGIIILPEYEGANIGFEIRLAVLELFGRTYAENE